MIQEVPKMNNKPRKSKKQVEVNIFEQQEIISKAEAIMSSLKVSGTNKYAF